LKEKQIVIWELGSGLGHLDLLSMIRIRSDLVTIVKIY